MTNFGERSGGFVWFFSFVTAFSELRDAEGLILLLDEPGLGLHAAGQADLLRYLDEQLAGGHQVVYTTSPFMVDADRPHRVRTVEDVQEEDLVREAPERPAATRSCPCPGRWPSPCWRAWEPARAPCSWAASPTSSTSR